MYDGWRITRWATPVADIDRLGLVSLTDSAGELSLTLEAYSAPGRPRWQVRFTNYPAYRNIDEAYRTELWAWLDRSDQRCGFTFTVEESPRFASWDASGYLGDFMPSVRHFVVATIDDVVEVLASKVPLWTELGPAPLESSVPGKVRHIHAGEDPSAVRETVKAVRRAVKRGAGLPPEGTG